MIPTADETGPCSNAAGDPRTAESSGSGQASGDSPSLRQVRSEFPGFEIWRETVVDRTRFIARARDLATSPHTVITGDLGELRDTLAGQVSTAGLPGEGRTGGRTSPGCIPT